MDKVLNKYGSYGDIFTALLKQAAQDLTAEGKEKVQVECSSYDVVHKQEYPENLDKVDAILMTGSSKYFLARSIFLRKRDRTKLYANRTMKRKRKNLAIHKKPNS